MNSIAAIFPQLSEPKRIVITMHQKPDPDAMGAALALFQVLEQGDHTVTVISPTNWADFLDWMPGCDKVLDYETNAFESHPTPPNCSFCLQML